MKHQKIRRLTPNLRAAIMAAILIATSLFSGGCNTTGDASKERIVTGGKIGFGTWATKAEFKDVYVLHNGEAFALKMQEDMSDLDTSRGTWNVEDGVLQQTSLWEDTKAVLTGNIPWTDYTIVLKARKTGGKEGFLILFGMTSADANYISRWNIGGWNNTAHALQVPGIDEKHIPGHIEEGRWYDIQIDVSPDTIRTYLDGELIQVAPEA